MEKTKDIEGSLKDIPKDLDKVRDAAHKGMDKIGKK